MGAHEAELRADMQRYYGICLDDVGEACSWRHAAALCACLPSDGALRRAEGDGWSEAERLVARAVQGIDTVWWQRTKEGQRNGAQGPEMPPSPKERAERAAAQFEYSAWDRDDIAERLGIPEERR